MSIGKVAVLGCGPAGLLAAHAVMQSGGTPVIYSKRVKSRIGGAQYLHVPIRGLTYPEADGKVSFVKSGDRNTYAEKVYGETDVPVSWDDFEAGPHEVWNMQQAYQILWTMYYPLIKDIELNAQEIVELDQTMPVLSTIPATALCVKEHKFVSQPVWISQERNCENMQILYNGTYDATWYRASSLWGFNYTEYSFDPSHTESVLVRKPLSTDCDCLPFVTRLGRYGRWEKKQLIHNAYVDVLTLVNSSLL